MYIAIYYVQKEVAKCLTEASSVEALCAWSSKVSKYIYIYVYTRIWI